MRNRVIGLTLASFVGTAAYGEVPDAKPQRIVFLQTTDNWLLNAYWRALLAEQYAAYPGFYPGWYWAGGPFGYTWLPGDGLLWSPFGYGFYSPYYIRGGGFIYGGGYGRGFYRGGYAGGYRGGALRAAGGGFHGGGGGGGGGGGHR